MFPGVGDVQSSVSRDKRAIPMVVRGIFEVLKFATGISKANKINRIEKTVDYIQKHQKEIKETLEEVQDSITVLQTETAELFLAIKDVAERSDAMDKLILCQQEKIKLERIMDSLLHKSVTTSIIPVESIGKLLESLKGTIYEIRPHLIYEMGRVQVLQSHVEESMMTLLVTIPHIKDKADGYLYSPLFVPRFQVEHGETYVEKLDPLTALIDVDESLPSPQGRKMVGVAPGTCSQKDTFLLCNLAHHFEDKSTRCSSALLQNVTDLKVLSEICGYGVEKSSSAHSFIAESSSHVLLFSNQDVTSSTDDGQFHLNNPHSGSQCMLINKLAVNTIQVGEKSILMNRRMDALQTDPAKEKSVQTLSANPVIVAKRSFLDFSSPMILLSLGLGCIIILGIFGCLIFYFFKRRVVNPDAP